MAKEAAEEALKAMPKVPINFVPAKAGDTFPLGPMTIRIMEDGSRTGMTASTHSTRPH